VRPHKESLVVPQGVKINRLLKLRQNVVPRGGITYTV
jgi:hypothetical protein